PALAARPRPRQLHVCPARGGSARRAARDVRLIGEGETSDFRPSVARPTRYNASVVSGAPRGAGGRGPRPTFFLGITRSKTVSATERQLEAVRTAVEPAIGALGCGLYDLEIAGAGKARTLRITVTLDTEGANDGRGSVDLDTITEVTRAVSPI